MKKNIFRFIVTIGTVMALVCSFSCAGFAEGNASGCRKNENVYARLGADGSCGGAYIVNHFYLDKDMTVTDYGNYTDVKNLSNTQAIDMKDGKVSFSAEKGHFYYQGNMDSVELPWNFSIEYILDGKKISPSELAGKSGKLLMKMSVEQNKKADSVFFDNYLLQISATLDEEIFTDIKAEDGTIADAGKDKNITFTVMPGTESVLEIEADVTDCETAGFSVAAVPYSMSFDLDDSETEDMTSGFDELTDAVEKLNDGAQEMSSGMKKLSENKNAISGGSDELYKGIKALGDNGVLLLKSSAEISGGLSKISGELASADFSALESLKLLPANLDKLADGLDGMLVGISALKKGFEGAYSVLDSAMAKAGQNLPSEEELQALAIAAQGNEAAMSAYNKLVQCYKELMTVKGTYNAVKDAFDGVVSALDENNKESVAYGIASVRSGISMMSQQLKESLGKQDIAGELKELAGGIKKLADNYGLFHDGLTSYVDGMSYIVPGFREYNAGLEKYLDGVDAASDGMQQYADGMQEFDDGIADMPDEIDEKLDELMEEYTGGDFDPVSFADSRNSSINAVQFVISTEGIKISEENEGIEEEKDMNFFERLMALFS